MFGKRRCHQPLIHERVRIVVGTPAAFLHHHLDLFIKLRLRHLQIVHAVGLQLHRQRQFGFMQLLKVSRVVVGGEGILASACRRDDFGELADRNGFGTLEHHMFQRMRHTCITCFLVHAPHVVPDLLHHNRCPVVFLDDDIEPVAQCLLECFRVCNCRNLQQQRDDN